jgi:hypothetical protein
MTIEFWLKRQRLIGAYEYLIGNQGYVGQGKDGAANVEVGIILAGKGSGFAGKRLPAIDQLA